MDTVFILQVVTISITVLTLVVNVLVTTLANKQKNYNEIITNSRLDFMKSNRDNAAKFTAEARNIVLMFQSGNYNIDVKPLYTYFEQLSIALKTYNSIDNEIITAGNRVVGLIEQSVINKKSNDELPKAIKEFSDLINIYDDADWRFIKKQFNSTTKKSEDFDEICNEVKKKYRD